MIGQRVTKDLREKTVARKNGGDSDNARSVKLGKGFERITMQHWKKEEEREEREERGERREEKEGGHRENIGPSRDAGQLLLASDTGITQDEKKQIIAVRISSPPMTGCGAKPVAVLSYQLLQGC